MRTLVITGTDADGNEVTEEVVVNEANKHFCTILRAWLEGRGYPEDHWIFRGENDTNSST